MKKICAYKNATVYVQIPDTDFHNNLKIATERFFRKVMKEYDNCNTPRNFKEK